MNKTTLLKWIVGAVVVGFALWLGVTFPRSNPVINQIVGGASGPVNYDRNFFLAGSTNGGYVATTSGLIATYTTEEKDFRQTPTYLVWTPNLALTVTITATSTFPYVPNVGDTAVVLIKNATTTAGTITWSAGSGLTLTKSEDDAANTTAYTATAKFTFIRTSTLTVTAIQENIN
jgi:hypothetical protein